MFYILYAGIGALYARRRPRVRLEPIQSGGGQERNIRSGTVPAPLVVGLGEACRIALQEKEVRPCFYWLFCYNFQHGVFAFTWYF